MHPARLFVCCGPPGSGTGPRAGELTERFRAVRLSLDDIVEAGGSALSDRGPFGAWLRSIISDLLRAGQIVVVEGAAADRTERDELHRIGRAAGANVHLEALVAPTAESAGFEPPDDAELALYDPMPPVRAGEQPGSPAFPYGSWRP